LYQPQTQTRPAAPAGTASAMHPEMPAIPLPPEPQTVEQTGLTLGFLADLALKTLYLRGQMSMADLASALGLSIQGVTDKIMDFLKTERLVEIRGGAGISSASYQFVIVDRGSEKAQEALARSQYVGKAPVPLATYIAAVQRQSISNIHVTPEDLARAFAHMVIPRETLAQLGPAVNSGKSIFLFGPPGNGKTTIGEVLVSLMRGEVVLPYAVGLALVMSSSVICTSTPAAANCCRLARKFDGYDEPPVKCACRPTQSIGTPRDLKSRTMFSTPCVFAAVALSML